MQQKSNKKFLFGTLYVKKSEVESKMRRNVKNFFLPHVWVRQIYLWFDSNLFYVYL